MAEYEYPTDQPEAEHLIGTEPTEYTPQLILPLKELIEISKTNKRGHPHTFGATPLDRYTTQHDQWSLAEDLTVLTLNPPTEIPSVIADYTQATLRERFFSRCAANDENYSMALIDKLFYNNPALFKIFKRAELGHASPAELLLTQQLLGIPSIELACLTHPYGRHIEILPTMRQAVNEAIVSMGGELLEDSEPKLRIKSVVLGHVPAAAMPHVYSQTNQESLKMAEDYGGVACLLITRKRSVGRMPDGAIIRERMSFCLRADSGSVLNQDDLNAIAQYEGDNWEDSALVEAGLDQIILNLIDENEFTQVIPVSTTIYSFNQLIQEYVENQQKRPIPIEERSWTNFID